MAENDAPNDSNQATLRARARLWLRAEQAFGVSALARGARGSAGGDDEMRDSRKLTPATARAPAANLFGIPENPAISMRAAGLMPPPAVGEFDAAPLPTEQKRSRLIAMENNEVRGCTKCRLCESRTNTVFGEGDPDAKIMFIGEGPGQTEDQTGRPFVGRAGEKLNEMIRAMGLTREQVYIQNIVKCRPPGNREPAPDEVATCTPYLERQIEIVRPRVIVTLGRPALQYMLNQKISISRMRGQWQTWRGIKLMPTFHPAYILRNYTRETREAVWSDLKQVLSELQMPIPSRRGAGGA
jgi:DNA polymerase